MTVTPAQARSLLGGWTPPEVLTRSDWGAAAADRRASRLSAARVTDTAVHHIGAGSRGLKSRADYIRTVQSIQRMHLRDRGWADVAYNHAVDPFGRVYELRGVGVRSAAQGTNAGNAAAHAVLYLSREGGPALTVEAAKAILWLHATAYDGFSSRLQRIQGHRDYRATACPGDDRMAWLSSGCQLDGLPSAGTDDTDNQEASTMAISKGDRGEAVRRWQEDLQEWAQLTGKDDPLPEFGADGDFGAETVAGTLVFYDAVGLEPADRSDPQVGDASRDALSDAIEAAGRHDGDEQSPPAMIPRTLVYAERGTADLEAAHFVARQRNATVGVTGSRIEAQRARALLADGGDGQLVLVGGPAAELDDGTDGLLVLAGRDRWATLEELVAASDDWTV